MRRRQAAWTALSRTLSMLRAGSADTIIAGRPLCILLLIRPFTALRRPRQRSRPTPTFLVVSALVPYKRLDVAIEACRQARRAAENCRARARRGRLRAPGRAGRRVPRVAHRTTRSGTCTAGATAVLLPGTEDFGMVPVEAQACGTPVVALGAGGALRNGRRTGSPGCS